MLPSSEFPEDEGSVFIQNVGINLTGDMMS
jgi:hypothetical protein